MSKVTEGKEKAQKWFQIKGNQRKMQGMTQHWILTCCLVSAPLVCGQSNLG